MCIYCNDYDDPTDEEVAPTETVRHEATGRHDSGLFERMIASLTAYFRH